MKHHVDPQPNGLLIQGGRKRIVDGGFHSKLSGDGHHRFQILNFKGQRVGAFEEKESRFWSCGFAKRFRVSPIYKCSGHSKPIQQQLQQQQQAIAQVVDAVGQAVGQLYAMFQSQTEPTTYSSTFETQQPEYVEESDY